MDLNAYEEEISDDEIYFGKVTIKEIKKRIFISKSRHTIGCLPVQRELSHDESLTLIETNSEPYSSGVMEINSPDPKSISGSYFTEIRLKSTDSDAKSSDDSFIRLEKMVTELCMSPKQDTEQVLDNTLDVVDFILNNVPPKDNTDDNNKSILEDNKLCLTDDVVVPPKDDNDKSILEDKKICLTGDVVVPPKDDNNKSILEDKKISLTGDVVVPPKDDNNKSILEDKKICLPDNVVTNSDMTDNKHFVNIQIDKVCNEITNHSDKPVKNEKTASNIARKIADHREAEIKSIYKKTPNKSKLHIEHVFKTPKSVLSCKNQSGSVVKKTPGRSSAYQHISSPVASYIKKSPQIPLLQAVHPKKPLPGMSSIPKLAKSMDNKIGNKENVQLPPIAYKSAKETKLVSAPDKEKLPNGQRIKKLITSLPQPLVIKHNQRQVNPSMKPLHSTQEDSFANLTLHQADLSVCTQKSAFTKFIGHSGNKP